MLYEYFIFYVRYEQCDFYAWYIPFPRCVLMLI